MALKIKQIEHFEYEWQQQSETPWKNWSKSRKWMKKQTNKFMRLKNKHIDDDDIGCKRGRRPLCGWEY